MPFQPKETQKKTKSLYKTLYLPQSLADAVQQLAVAHGTSFNNVVVSMIEYCLQEQTEPGAEEPPPQVK